MTTVLLGARIVTFFVFTAIWVRRFQQHARFRALCNIFQAIRAPPPPFKAEVARTLMRPFERLKENGAECMIESIAAARIRLSRLDA